MTEATILLEISPRAGSSIPAETPGVCRVSVGKCNRVPAGVFYACSLFIGFHLLLSGLPGPLKKRIIVRLRIPELLKKPFNNNNHARYDENSPK
jgi:hypothetical protein